MRGWRMASDTTRPHISPDQPQITRSPAIHRHSQATPVSLTTQPTLPQGLGPLGCLRKRRRATPRPFGQLRPARVAQRPTQQPPCGHRRTQGAAGVGGRRGAALGLAASRQREAQCPRAPAAWPAPLRA